MRSTSIEKFKKKRASRYQQESATLAKKASVNKVQSTKVAEKVKADFDIDIREFDVSWKKVFQDGLLLLLALMSFGVIITLAYIISL